MKFTIIDDGPVGSLAPNVVLWSRFSKEAGDCILSVPDLLRADSDSARRRFLRWVYDLGEARIEGRRVIDILSMSHELSYWWLTPASHTPNLYEAEWVDDAIKCLAFESWCADAPAMTGIQLVSSNQTLHQVMAGFCSRTGRQFDGVVVDGAQRRREVYRYTRNAVSQSLELLAETLRFTPRVPKASGAPRWCFIDHLTYLKPDAVERGEFASAYWEELVPYLEASNADVTWVHNLFPNKSVPTLASAKRLIKKFNRKASGLHLLTEQWLTPSALWSAARDSGRLMAKARTLCALADHNARCPEGSHFDFWPFVAPGLLNSLRPWAVCRQSLRMAAMVRLFRQLPTQDLGVYIQENQPWEMALLYAWRQAGHGPIVGVQHSTVRYWDLRNFYDPASYSQADPLALPRPDRVAVNGPLGWRQYIRGGYPQHELTRVEALRFAHLRSLRGNQRQEPPLVILVCGDNIPTANERLIAVVAEAGRLLPSDTEFLLKPHPAAPFDLPPDLAFRYQTTEEPLADVLARVNAVITSSTTSASLEAFCAGLPVAVFHDGHSLNTSPLLGVADESFASNAGELVGALTKGSVEPRRPDMFFDYDDGLRRWRELLGGVATPSQSEPCAAAICDPPASPQGAATLPLAQGAHADHLCRHSHQEP